MPLPLLLAYSVLRHTKSMRYEHDAMLHLLEF